MWARIHLTGAPGPPQGPWGFSGRCGPTSTLTGALSHLRTRGEVSGNCGPASMLTGTPEQPQDLRGGFRKMWCHVHSSSSSRAPQDISSGFWKLGAAFMVTGAPASSESSVMLWEDLRPHGHNRNADFLRTPSVDLGKYGDASMGTEDPSLVRACGEA